MADFNPLDYGTPVEESFNPSDYGTPVDGPNIITQGGEIPLQEDGNIFDPALETIKNIAKVYPAIETGLNLLTSTYGIPAAGLGGLATLFATGDLSNADKAIKKIQEALVYMPKTEGGEQLTGAVSYPFEKLDQAGAYVGGEIEQVGYPNLAAGVHSAISSIPVAIGGKMMLGKVPGKPLSVVGQEISSAIKKGVNKAIRPSVVKKATSSQVERYFKQAESAIESVIKNKDNLNLIDETGAKIEGLPKNLDQFSQAIEQTKRNVFQEYDILAKTAADKGVQIDLNATSKKINAVTDSRVLKDLSPETIKYAEMRAESLKGRASYTAVETQEAIQMLNQTLEQFYRDPSPDMKGKALVDSLIANDLRKQLDTTIQNSTGAEYGSLKKQYGDLKAIESDVTKRSIVDARKNNKGLLDFSDIFSGHQVIKGVLAKDPAALTAGAASKGISHYYKMLNDPNRIVKNMFGDVEKLIQKKVETPAPNRGIQYQDITNGILQRYKMGDFSKRQIDMVDELKRRGAL